MATKKYIHELKAWPHFEWDQKELSVRLAAVRHAQGRLIGRMEGLGFLLQEEAVLQSLTEEVVKSSEIEGESLNRQQVRSSIARRLGIDVGGLVAVPRHVDGVVELMVDATQKFSQTLTQERLFGWHSALFPSGRSGMFKIRVGNWRDDSNGPMQVVSGPVGKERIHFEAPAAKRLVHEIKLFLKWFNDRQRKIVNKLLDGFEGKLTSSKWAAIGKCSQDTALRDIEDLIKRKVLKKNPEGGRSTSYSVRME